MKTGAITRAKLQSNLKSDTVAVFMVLPWYPQYYRDSKRMEDLG